MCPRPPCAKRLHETGRSLAAASVQNPMISWPPRCVRSPAFPFADPITPRQHLPNETFPPLTLPPSDPTTCNIASEPVAKLDVCCVLFVSPAGRQCRALGAARRIIWTAQPDPPFVLFWNIRLSGLCVSGPKFLGSSGSRVQVSSGPKASGPRPRVPSP